MQVKRFFIFITVKISIKDKKVSAQLYAKHSQAKQRFFKNILLHKLTQNNIE